MLDFIFQSTLPYGSDYFHLYLHLLPDYFNPRSLTGATEQMKRQLQKYDISIHAPLRERPLLRARHSLISEFQSTLPYGSDKVHCHIDSLYQYFNPRSLTGATLMTFRILSALLFQSTLPYGSDFAKISAKLYSEDFNPRSLTGATHDVPPLIRKD